MATQTDLAQAVLEELRVVGAGETIDSDDDALVKRRYLSVHRDLARKFLVDWAESEAIPDAALDAMTLLVAFRCQTAFGKPRDVQVKLDGMAMLWDYRNTPWLPTPPMRATYF